MLSADGQNQVGKISKQWTGLIKEAFTDADNFGITCESSLMLSTSVHVYLAVSGSNLYPAFLQEVRVPSPLQSFTQNSSVTQGFKTHVHVTFWKANFLEVKCSTNFLFLVFTLE